MSKKGKERGRERLMLEWREKGPFCPPVKGSTFLESPS